MPNKIVATACCRVDLAGGTLDIWPLYLFHAGAVTVNFAVDVMTRCEIEPRHRGIVLRSMDTGRTDEFSTVDDLLRAKRMRHSLAGYLCRHFFTPATAPRSGFTLTTHSESPAGAGISGSSALMVATTAALARWVGQWPSKEQMRVVAQNVEAQLINVPTGCQDYYPPLYGGVNAIHLTAAGIQRQAIQLAPTDLNQRFVLAYTGAPRQSGINNWKVFQAHVNGDRRIHKNFNRIAEIAQGMHSALQQQDWDAVTRLLRAEWKLRKTNAPGITTPLIEKLIAVANREGATAAKVCGAGGGGCVVFLTHPEAKQRVAQALSVAGATVLRAKVGISGVKVCENG